jgi:hypothetical protein
MVSSILVKFTLVSKLLKMNGELLTVLKLNQSSVNVLTLLNDLIDIII